MSRRPTTAEILAAAREKRARPVADRKPVVNVASAESDPASHQKSPDTAVVINGTGTDDVGPAEADRPARGRPASMAAILRNVRSGRESLIAADNGSDKATTPILPPSIRDILNRLRASLPSPSSVVPPSVATMLAAIRTGRQSTAGSPVAGRPVAKSEADPPAAADRKGRPSTAEILAAARAKTAARDAGAAPQASYSSSSLPPAAASKTSSILEAARRQGGAGGAAAAGSSPPVKSPKKALATAVARSNDTAIAVGQTDDRPRPASMAAVLANVRGEQLREMTAAVYPTLEEMVAELRGQEQRRREALRGETSSNSTGGGVISGVVSWWHRKRGTHRGASI